MEDLVKEMKDIIWIPYMSHNEKAEHIINLLELAYQRGYHQGMDDMLHDIRKLLKDEFGD